MRLNFLAVEIVHIYISPSLGVQSVNIVRVLANKISNVCDFWCLEHCRACGSSVKSHRAQHAEIKAVCRSCWSDISSHRPAKRLLAIDEQQSFPIVSAVNYCGPIKKLIYKLKYDGDCLLPGDLSELLMIAWDSYEQLNGELLLVPIPLHPKRLKSRGFNQAELLARQLAGLAGLPVDTQALKRIKATEAQHNLGRAERMLNLSGAFRGDCAKVTGKTVVLVDDIFTSGATLKEAAREVLSLGAFKVVGITIACADLS